LWEVHGGGFAGLFGIAGGAVIHLGKQCGCGRRQRQIRPLIGHPEESSYGGANQDGEWASPARGESLPGRRELLRLGVSLAE